MFVYNVEVMALLFYLVSFKWAVVEMFDDEWLSLIMVGVLFSLISLFPRQDKEMF